ncbi:unnamed protein product, partial [Rhizoctonia solani]
MATCGSVLVSRSREASYYIHCPSQDRLTKTIFILQPVINMLRRLIGSAFVGTELVDIVTPDPDSKRELQSLSLSLIRLALGLRRHTEVGTAEDFLVMMYALVHIDEILRYACSPGEVDLAYLERQVRSLRNVIEGDPKNAFKLQNGHGISVTLIGGKVVPGLGWKAIPTPLVSFGDTVDMYIHPGPELTGHHCAGPSPGLSLSGLGSDSGRLSSSIPSPSPGPAPSRCLTLLVHLGPVQLSGPFCLDRELGEEREDEERLLLNAYIAQLSKR